VWCFFYLLLAVFALDYWLGDGPGDDGPFFM
jgi:hypothetical protein